MGTREWRDAFLASSRADQLFDLDAVLSAGLLEDDVEPEAEPSSLFHDFLHGPGSPGGG